MNNTQFYFALGVPFFTVVLMYIVNTVSNRASVNDLRMEMRSAISDLRSEMKSGFADLAGSMNRIENRMDRIENRMDRLDQRLDKIDTEIRINHDQRLATLEAGVLGWVG